MSNIELSNREIEVAIFALANVDVLTGGGPQDDEILPLIEKLRVELERRGVPVVRPREWFDGK